MSLFYKTVSLNNVHPTTLTVDPTNIYTPTQLSWLETYPKQFKRLSFNHPDIGHQKFRREMYQQGIIEPMNQHLAQLLTSDPSNMQTEIITNVVLLIIKPSKFRRTEMRFMGTLQRNNNQLLFTHILDELKRDINKMSLLNCKNKQGIHMHTIIIHA